MRREPVRIAAVRLAMLGLLVACAKPGTSVPPQGSRPPDTAEQTYTPVSRVSETWGLLQYSNKRARLAAFEGSMQLESVGIMPDTAGSDLAGAQVYRVRNAEDSSNETRTATDSARNPRAGWPFGRSRAIHSRAATAGVRS
jgi:hypothetical protein